MLKIDVHLQHNQHLEQPQPQVNVLIIHVPHILQLMVNVVYSIIGHKHNNNYVHKNQQDAQNLIQVH
jgi:hypothetical protein